MFYGSCLAYDKVRPSRLPAGSRARGASADMHSPLQALRGEDQLSAAMLRNIFNGDTGRKKDAAALARYVQW